MSQQQQQVDEAPAIFLASGSEGQQQQQQQVPECSKVNWLPFGIALDGPVSNTATYFDPQPDAPSTSSSSNAAAQHHVAHFRGRQLKGVTKALPDGFQGLVLKPTGSNSNNNGASTSDAQQRSWQAVGRFSQVVLWGHDAAPAATDPHMRSIDWLALADQVHQPVSAAQVVEEMQRMQEQAVS